MSEEIEKEQESQGVRRNRKNVNIYNPTPAEKAAHAKTHKVLVKGITERWSKVAQFVDRKFSADSKPLMIDKKR
jgi:hypothetical protein